MTQEDNAWLDKYVLCERSHSLKTQGNHTNMPGRLSEVVKTLLSGMVPGPNESRPEMLKALDIVGLFWLTHLFDVFWK